MRTYIHTYLRALANNGNLIAIETRDCTTTHIHYYSTTHQRHHANDNVMKESVDLMRMGKAEINATPDGIDMGGAFLESLMLAGILTRDGLTDPDDPGFRQGIEIYREIMYSTPAYAVLTTPGNSSLDHIDAGRRWLRLNLTTTRMGLALHPISQALQEYPEMDALYAKAHDMLAPKGHTVQMLGRLGYGPQTPRTPRWPLEAKLSRA